MSLYVFLKDYISTHHKHLLPIAQPTYPRKLITNLVSQQLEAFSQIFFLSRLDLPLDTQIVMGFDFQGFLF